MDGDVASSDISLGTTASQADDGAELLNYVKRQDVDVWSKRQTFLNDHGAFLKVDGIAGPNTMAAMHAQGFRRGQDMPN